MLYHTLKRFKTWVNKNGNTVIVVSGTTQYYSVLRDAFPLFHFSPAWPEVYRDGEYDWGTFINNIGDEDRQQVVQFLNAIKPTVLIEDGLKQTFALDFHIVSFHGRTEIGNIVYNAKYHKSETDAENLIDRFQNFILCHPSYLRSDLLIPVPPSKPGKSSLSSYLARSLCERLGIQNGQQYVEKVRETKPMKDLETSEEKFENIQGAFEVTDKSALSGKRVTLIDDIYHSGATLNEMASVLQQVGALVQGLVATKTRRDVD